MLYIYAILLCWPFWKWFQNTAMCYFILSEIMFGWMFEQILTSLRIYPKAMNIQPATLEILDATTWTSLCWHWDYGATPGAAHGNGQCITVDIWSLTQILSPQVQYQWFSHSVCQLDLTLKGGFLVSHIWSGLIKLHPQWQHTHSMTSPPATNSGTHYPRL